MRLAALARSALLGAALLVAAPPASAASDEKAARAGQRAMDELFAAAKFDQAKAALEKTLAGCRACSPHTKALLHRNLAVVLMTGLGDQQKGRAEMKTARKLDPSLTLDPAVTTPEVQAAFDAAGGGAALSGKSKKEAIEQSVTLEDDSDSDSEAEEPPAHHAKAQAEPEPVSEPEPASEAEPPGCTEDSDCAGGQKCSFGKCVAPPERPRERGTWLTLGLVQDFAIVSGSDVCTKASQVTGGFTCIRSSGSQYHGTPVPGGAGTVSGLALSSTRVALGSQFRLWDKVSGLLRVAFAVAGQGPQPDGGKKFLPLEAEIGGAYWLSKKALSTESIGTFIGLSGGVAEIDGAKAAIIRENTSVPPPANQIDNPPTQTLNAWRKAGSGFVAASGGAFLPFGRGAGLMGDLRVMALFPSPGAALSLGISGALGL